MIRKFNRKIHLLIASNILIAFCSCSLSSIFELKVVLPPFISVQKEIDLEPYLISFSPDGNEFRTDITSLESISITTPVLTGTPVLYYPHPYAKPAGGWYEPHKEELSLEWDKGPAAEICFSLFRLGYQPGSVNLPKLQDYMLKNTSDPWIWDQSVIVDDILRGSLSSYSFIRKEEHSIDFCVPEGLWIPGNPYKDLIKSNGNTVSLSIGSDPEYYFNSFTGNWAVLGKSERHTGIVLIHSVSK